MSSGEANVTFDMATGAIKGAGPVQYAGMRAMALAAKTLRPLDDFGFSYAARLLRTLLPADKMVKVCFDGDRCFQFPYGDAYWSLLLNRNHVYEEEIKVFLLAMRSVEFAFLDCGANYGYWSVHVSSEKFGKHPSVAIEADEETFSLLQDNCSMNAQRFEIMRRAISNQDDEVVAMYGKKHEARTIIAEEGAQPRSQVNTISLDTLSESEVFLAAEKIVLKLDVEGVEVAALEGGKKLLERDIIVVYEDHGADRNHEVTAYIMNQAGMRTYAYDGGRFVNLTSIRELDAMKKNRRRGYDFFATKSAFWQEKMEQLVAAGPGLK